MRNVKLHRYYPGEGEVVEVIPSWESLTLRMDELRDFYSRQLPIPYSVDLVQGNGDRLSVGLGDSFWILTFSPGDGRCASLTSLGDESAEGTVQFFFGDWTEMSRKYLVPRDAALEVVRDWVDKGVLSNAIAWTSRLY